MLPQQQSEQSLVGGGAHPSLGHLLPRTERGSWRAGEGGREIHPSGVGSSWTPRTKRQGEEVSMKLGHRAREPTMHSKLGILTAHTPWSRRGLGC